MSKAQITIPLDIADVYACCKLHWENGALIITIESTQDGTRCHKCGEVDQEIARTG